MKRRRGFIIGLIAAFSFSVASCVDDPVISSQEESLESSLSSSSSSSKRSSSRTTEQTSVDPITLLNFELNEDGQSYSVTPKGDVIRDITIPSTYNGLPVSSIPDYSFGLCRSMKKITMPDSIVSIGVQAFNGCNALEEINFSNSLTSFPDRMCFGCKSLSSVNIPSGVTTIGENAFERCSSIKEVNFPNTLTSIGKEAFSECISIETLNIPSGVIREKAFYQCVSVVSLILGEGVTDIEEWAFLECYRLVELVNKSSLPLTIGGGGYGGVTAFVKHLITNENNMRVTKGLLKDCITYNEQAFLWLVSYYGLLKDKITIPNGIKGINGHCFDSYGSGFYDELIDVRIPEGVTIIGDYAFNYCEALYLISFPNTLDSIGRYAFYRCKMFTELTLPDGLTSIGDYAFSDCSQLRVITLPDTLTSIGDYAFNHDGQLEIINFSGTMAEWAAVERAPDWGKHLRVKTITCTDGLAPANPPADSSSQN